MDRDYEMATVYKIRGVDNQITIPLPTIDLGHDYQMAFLSNVFPKGGD